MNKIKSILIVIVALLHASAVSAIDFGGCATARQMVKEKRYAEAIAVYEKLDDSTKDESDNQAYMSQAITIANDSLKDQELGFRLAQRVRNAEMRAFYSMPLYKPEELITKYKDFDFMKWPEDIRAESYQLRGHAYSALKQYPEAVRDFETGVDLPGGGPAEKGIAAKTAGDIYLSQLKDEAKAEKMYRKVLAVTNAGYWFRNESLLTLAGILLKNKRNDEALNLYKDLDIKGNGSPYWKVTLACGYAKALAANGQKVKAVEYLNMALQAETNQANKKLIQAEIDKLTKDMLE